MKSPDGGEWTDLISSEAFAEDFIQTCLDFIRVLRGFHSCLGVVMKENKLAELSMNFAVDVLKSCENIKGHYSIINQLERSATSIGANIREAKYAHSKPDFVSKLQISLKECYETEYWLELIQKANIITDVSNLMHNCGVIRKMLITSINTAKENG